MKLTIILSVEFVSIWWPCLVVFRLRGNNAGVSDLLFSDFLWFFFTPPTDPKPGNSFDAKRTPITAPSVFFQFLPLKTSIFDSVFMKAKQQSASLPVAADIACARLLDSARVFRISFYTFLLNDFSPLSWSVEQATADTSDPTGNHKGSFFPQKLTSFSVCW